MTKLPAFSGLALLALAACSPAPQQVDTTAPDPNADAVNAAIGNVVLPPAMTGEVTFRCRDQSLVTVDFFQGDTQVMVKATPDDTGTRLTAPAAGQPYVAEGYRLTGDRTAITITQPGKSELTCRA